MKNILLFASLLLSGSSYAASNGSKFFCESKYKNPNYKEYNLKYIQEVIVGNPQEMFLRNLSNEIDIPKEVCEVLKNEISTQALKVEWITIRHNPYGACKWTSYEKRIGFSISTRGSQLIGGHPVMVWFYPNGPDSDDFKIEANDPEWDDKQACWP